MGFVVGGHNDMSACEMYCNPQQLQKLLSDTVPHLLPFASYCQCFPYTVFDVLQAACRVRCCCLGLMQSGAVLIPVYGIMLFVQLSGLTSSK